MENKLKVLEPTTPPTFESRSEWEGFQQQVTRAFDTGLLPDSVKNPQQAIILAAKGREMGLEPLYALSVLYLIHNKPALEGEAMLGLTLRKYPNAQIQWVEQSHKRACLKMGRPGGQLSEFEFTVEDAKRAGLISKINEDGTVTASGGKQVWSQYTKDMLMWRAVARAIRFLFPECIQGCLIPDEAKWVPKGTREVGPDKAAQLKQELLQSENV